MDPGVLAFQKHFEVFYPVVSLVLIAVVNDFVTSKRTAKMFGHKKSVKQNPPAAVCHGVAA